MDHGRRCHHRAVVGARSARSVSEVARLERRRERREREDEQRDGTQFLGHGANSETEIVSSIHPQGASACHGRRSSYVPDEQQRHRFQQLLHRGRFVKEGFVLPQAAFLPEQRIDKPGEVKHLQVWFALAQAPGEFVAIHSDGLEARPLVEAQPRPFDLFVLDVLMPLMRGDELGRQLRQRDPDVKALYFTATATGCLGGGRRALGTGSIH